MKTSASFYWVCSFICSLLILATVPVARPLQKLLERNFKSGISYLLTALFILAAIELFRRFIWNPRRFSVQFLVLFSLIAAGYAWRLSRLPVAVERFHLIEYGCLAIFVLLACHRMDSGWVGLGWAMSAVLFVGLCDELFQYYWPGRYGEWRDVVINMESGAMALLSLILLNPLKGIMHASAARSQAFLFFTLACLSVLSGCFFLHVQQFGFEISDPEFGRFRSHFQAAELLKITQRNCNAYFSGPNTKASENKTISRDLYFKEAKQHFDRSKLLLQLHRWNDAYREHLVFNRYFSGAAESFRYTADESRKFEKHRVSGSQHFLSQPMDYLVVHLDSTQVKWISAICFLIFFCAGLARLLFRPSVP